MNYDIKISQDGCPVFVDGDFSPVDFAEFISQKIYKALMNMEITRVSGLPSTKPDVLEASILDYLTTQFYRDLYVQPQGISVKVTVLPGDDSAKFVISYKGMSPEGRIVEFSSNLMYSVKSGAVLSVDYEPGWLSLPKYMAEKELQFPVSVTSPTQDIEIPMAPYPSSSTENGTAGISSITLPIYILSTDQLDTISDTETKEFTITLRSTRSKYQLSAYIAGFVRRESIVESYEFDDTDISYRVTDEYGETVVLVDKGTEGTLTGEVTLRKAMLSTTSYIVKSPLTVSPVFPLRRHRGKYFARFPKTVPIGNYYIKYTAISEE